MNVIESDMEPSILWPAGSDRWQDCFLSWLNNSKVNENIEAEQQQLSNWLNGNDLPALGSDMPPFLFILRTMPHGADGTELIRPLSRIVATALVRATNDLGDGPLYNLLQLTSGLAQPDELADSLDSLIQRLDLRNRFYRGQNLVVALRVALVLNQSDDRWFKTVWRPMIQGLPDTKIPGTWMDGVEGILHMPESGTELRNALGWAIKQRDPGNDANESIVKEFYEDLDWLQKTSDFSYDDLWEIMLRAGCSEKALRWNIVNTCGPETLVPAGSDGIEETLKTKQIWSLDFQYALMERSMNRRCHRER